MRTDQVKNIGKIQEQIEVENKSRRNYPRKWSKFYQEAPWKEMYNQDEINKQLTMDLKDHIPFVYSNEGDSYFVSSEMFSSLVAVCRCGRSRSGLHMLKCLQNQQKYLDKTQSKINDTNGNLIKLPETTSGFVGWRTQKAYYKQWENSMKYVSPLYDVPGGRITATSYNSIIIG